MRRTSKPPPVPLEPDQDLTEEQFCFKHNMSARHLQRLKEQGRGPRMMLVGNKATRITPEADRDWVKEREAERAAQVEERLAKRQAAE